MREHRYSLTNRPYAHRLRIDCREHRTKRPDDPMVLWERYAYRAVAAASAVLLLGLVAAGEAELLR